MTTAPRDVATRIADLERAIRDLQRAPRLANASIEGFPLTVNDEDGVQRQTIGLQPDGTYTTTDVNGPPPPMPSLPTLEARPGTLVVTWDGKFLDDVAAPADWDHVEVHVSDVSGYTPTDETQVATFDTLKGGSVTLALDPVAQYVVLQAVSTSRTESTPTPETPGTPLPVTTDGGIKTYYEDTPPLGLGADDDGSLWFDTNDGNHQYRWDGPTLQWLTVRDSSIAAAAAAAATAQTQANDALTAAQAAQATADGSIRTFYQSSAPWANGSSQPPEVVGDLWFDTDDGQAYRWSGTAWVIIEDNSIAAALAAAMNAQTTADGKITSYYQTTAPVIGELGDLWFDTNDGNKPYYCSSVTPVTWTSIRDGSIADAQSTADDALAAATTDGLPPAASPDPVALPSIGAIIVRWAGITNHDPVRYEVHISTTSGFTPDMATNSTTRVGWTTGTQLTINALPGAAPAPGDPDPRKLLYETAYYVVIVAVDDDGAAPQSLQAAGGAFKVTGVDLEVDSVTAANVVLGTLTGDLFSATVIYSGTFKTAETGQRVWTGTAGIQGYRSDGSLMISIPTEDGQEILLDGEIIAQRLTVTGGASFQSMDSEFTADSALTLMRGIVAPSASPQLAVGYDYVQPSTAALATVDKTGPDLGTFDFLASEVSCIEWRPSLSCFSVYQVRPGGTREWYINTSGAPVAPSGDYFLDWADWEIWSATEILSNPTPAKIGHYLMFRYMPSGTDYYCYAANGALFRYSRQNGVAAPVMGNNGTDVYVAEVIASTHLSIRYFNLTGASGNFPAPTTAYESTQGFVASQPLACVVNGTYDVGARYLAASRGVSTKAWLLVTNGTNANSIFPGSTSNNWGSANVDAETFEAPAANRRGMAWDGTQFWSLHGDGFLYKHTGERWDPAVASSTYWGKLTFNDSNATGGTHETAPGAAKSYVAKRRSKNTVAAVPIPGAGGTNDPNNFRLYTGRGATLPANSSFHLQYEGTAATSFTTLATATATPPTVGNFPSTNPAKIRNDNDELVISGDGSIKGKQIFIGSDEVLAAPPYYYAWINSQAAVATDTLTTITGLTGDGSPFNAGISLASGIFTLARAGRYNFKAQLYWALLAGATGQRLFQVVMVSPGLTIDSHTQVPSTTVDVVNQLDKDYRVAAGAQVFFRFRHRQGASLAPTVSSLDLSWVQITYKGP